MNYVSQKLDSQNFKYQIKNLERKIEIANLSFQKAKKVMKIEECPPYEEPKAAQNISSGRQEENAEEI